MGRNNVTETFTIQALIVTYQQFINKNCKQTKTQQEARIICLVVSLHSPHQFLYQCPPESVKTLIIHKYLNLFTYLSHQVVKYQLVILHTSIHICNI